MGRKRSRSGSQPEAVDDDSPPTAVQPSPSESKWINRQRVLVFGCRGLSHRDRHLMEDLRTLMPHGKPDSKMHRKKDSLFAVNEMAEMKNCNKVVLFEGRRKRDLYMWLANVARGPSAKFVVENVHTMAELKMTGNCLKGSRPLVSFDRSFVDSHHHRLLKELLAQMFSVPNKHPKSQPFFDRVYTFSVVDDKIWFRHYQIVEEDGSLAEIGPRFVLNPVKIFESSFSGATLWENPKYVSPASSRAMLKNAKAGKYQRSIEAKAAHEANRPNGPTYKVDQTDDVFSSAALAAEDDETVAKKRKKLKS